MSTRGKVQKEHAARTVFLVQPRRWGGAHEELGSVSARACIRHREDAWLVVLQDEVLITELGAIYRLPAGAVPVGEIASLAHELQQDSVTD